MKLRLASIDGTNSRYLGGASAWQGVKIQGFLLDHGVCTPFSFPGASSTLPFGLSNSNQIVGWEY